MFIAVFSILFTRNVSAVALQLRRGRAPLDARVTLYVLLMRDEYPPFSLEP